MDDNKAAGKSDHMEYFITSYGIKKGLYMYDVLHVSL